jgi:hypothetical protein
LTIFPALAGFNFVRFSIRKSGNKNNPAPSGEIFRVKVSKADVFGGELRYQINKTMTVTPDGARVFNLKYFVDIIEIWSIALSVCW